MKLPADSWLVVADARKAMLLRNYGDAKYPNLKVEEVLKAPPNPETHRQGADRPGRSHASSDERRSAMDESDWHDLAERAFMREIARRLDRLCAEGRITKLIVAAPPRALGALRPELSPAVREAVLAELDRDLTKEPVDRLEAALQALSGTANRDCHAAVRPQRHPATGREDRGGAGRRPGPA